MEGWLPPNSSTKYYGGVRGNKGSKFGNRGFLEVEDSTYYSLYSNREGQRLRFEMCIKETGPLLIMP
jgi:hypothetical protein